MTFNVHSSAIRRTRNYRTLDEAISAFERKCYRNGVPVPLHYPANVAGDSFEDFGTFVRLQGPRDGHGIVYIEKYR